MTKKITYKGESKTLEYYKGMSWERELTKAMKDYEKETGKNAVYRGVITGGFEFWMYWKPKSKLSKKVDVIMDVFNAIIEIALNSEDNQADIILINSFTRFRENIKDLKGTGSGVTGICEFLYFAYIKKYFEDKLDLKFTKKESKGVNYFSGKLKSRKEKIILSSDIHIKKHFNLQIGILKPDIYIGIRTPEKKMIPIAIIEVKLYRSPKEFAKEVNERFRKIKEKIQAIQEYPFFVCLFLGSKENPDLDKKIEEFLDLSEKCIIMRKVRSIKDWDSVEKAFRGEIRGSYINDILDAILTEIRKKTHY